MNSKDKIIAIIFTILVFICVELSGYENSASGFSLYRYTHIIYSYSKIPFSFSDYKIVI